MGTKSETWTLSTLQRLSSPTKETKGYELESNLESSRMDTNVETNASQNIGSGTGVTAAESGDIG